MDKKITIFIDNREIHVREGTSIIEAADQAGIYIPRLCHHPDLPPGPGTTTVSRVYQCEEEALNGNSDGAQHGGCNICLVEIEGKGPSRSCDTPVHEGMVIYSHTPAISELRKENLARIVSCHPHACILCAQREGCDRSECSQGVAKQERCCQEFDDCEFRKVIEYVTLRDDVSKYVHRELPLADTPFFTVDHNLCIGCFRCVRACEKTSGKTVIGFVNRDDVFHLGTIGSSYKESGCKFCGACVEVCPTGARKDKGLSWKKKERLGLSPVTLPPEKRSPFTKDFVEKVPRISGVYELMDEKRNVILIRGTPDVHQDLQEKLLSPGNARFFRYQEHGMYSTRENEMLEKHLKKHGTLPEVNNEISDLY